MREMTYAEITGKMPNGVVEIVELWARRIKDGRTKGAVTGKDLTDVYRGKIKGALEVMEEMDFITDDERWALYRYYGIAKSVADPRFDIIVR